MQKNDRSFNYKAENTEACRAPYEIQNSMFP